MEIRKTKIEELDIVMGIYARARRFMVEHGNPNQWGQTHPTRDMIEKDIEEQKSYVCVEDDKIAGVFYFAIEEDPCYKEIFEGTWKNNKPYAVVHRIASAGTVKGAGSFCLRWACEQYDNVRIDTHKENIVMQNTLKKCGFEYCGVVYVRDHSERIAYQKVGYAKQKAFIQSLDFMRLGQAINRSQWQSAAMTLQRMRRNAKQAGITEFDRQFMGIGQCINRKNGQEAKQVLALIVAKRVKMINELKLIG